MARWKRPESVLVVVYNDAGEVLLLRRRDPGDFWQSVTGSLEQGEAPIETARRELREETGLEAADELCDTGVVNRFPIHPAWRARYAPEVSENTEYVFLLPVHGRPAVRLNPAEHVEYVWLPRDAAAGLASSETNREAIRRLNDFGPTGGNAL